MYRQIQDAIRTLWSHRELIRQLTYREIGQRYRGSFLGILWSFITPLALLAIYTFVFSGVFRAQWRTDQPSTTGEFALTVLAGLAAFNLFSEVANRSPLVILANPNYVKKVVFPLEIWPLVITGSAFANSTITCGLIVLGNVVLSHKLSMLIWILPLAYVPLLLITLGTSYFLASLGVYVRDIGQGIGLVVQVLLFLSPVFYAPSAVPEEWKQAYQLNPMTAILTSFRQILIWGESPDWALWATWTGIGAIVLLLGYIWFMKTKKGFADVL